MRSGAPFTEAWALNQLERLGWYPYAVTRVQVKGIKPHIYLTRDVDEETSEFALLAASSQPKRMALNLRVWGQLVNDKPDVFFVNQPHTLFLRVPYISIADRLRRAAIVPARRGDELALFEVSAMLRVVKR